MPDFDDATALTSTDDATSATLEWNGFMTRDWSIGPVPNGGYTGAMMTRALLDHTGCAAPISFTAHYYRPTIGDAPCTIRTEVVRQGRSTTHADAVLIQEDKVRARAVSVLGSYPDPSVMAATVPPPIDPPDLCPTRDPQSQGLNMTLLDSLEVRLEPSFESSGGAPLGDGEHVRIDGWVRFRDGRPNDALGLVLFADAFPPAILKTAPETGWVPTVEMTSHIRAEAAPGWIRGEVITSNVRGGTLIEDVRLWDQNDVLVVEARQLALLKI